MAFDLSNLNGSNGFRLDGGSRVAGAGDVNGDGLDDVVGGARVVFGSADGFPANFDAALDGANGFLLEETYEYTGIGSVVGAGDVNGDGIGDLVVGTFGLDYNPGAIYVVLGSVVGFASSVDIGELDDTDGFVLVGAYGYDGQDSVASAGDINGDGLDDLVIDSGYSGSYVVFGSAAGFPTRFDRATLDGANGFRVYIGGLEWHDVSVAGAGDVNGDGIDDLIIGAPYADASYAGASYVMFGSAAGFAASFDLATLDGATGFRVDGIDQADNSGSSVAGAGDVNGDGIGDLVIGAPHADDRAGESYVVFGSASGFAARLELAELNGANGFRIVGIDADDRSGSAVASAGDVNGDGIDDLVIGAPDADDYAGESYLVLGSAASFPEHIDLAALDGTNGIRFDGIDAGDYDAGDYSGASVAGAGDVNGDGFDDLIIGTDRAGESYVVFGSEKLGGPNIAPTAADDALTVGAFDVIDLADDNGAGYDRDANLDGLSITAIDGAPISPGDSVTLPSGLRVTFLGGTKVQFDAPGARLGTSVSDGLFYEISDGRGGSDTATVSINYAQNAIDLAALDGVNGFRLDGERTDDFSGRSVSAAGDVNGDGLDDLIIGAPGHYGRAGRSYVVFGSTAGFAANFDLATLDGSNGFGLKGTSYSTGNSVAGAGDVNGDGIDDLIIGAPECYGRAGRSYVVFGSAAGFGPSLYLAALDGANGFRIDGIDASDYCGTSVAGAGDVNGDGIDDLIIGAKSAHSGGFLSGESYVVFGSAAGFAARIGLTSLNGTNGFRLSGDEYDRSGSSVAAAGDINADGIDDLIIGAPRAGEPSAGESYVVFGSEAGFAANFDLDALDGVNGFRLDGVNQSDHSGWSVATAGDVNGDGIDDLLVGAKYSDSGGFLSGESYVVFGSAAGFEPSLDLAALDGGNGFRLGGINEGDQSGVSVAGAGDVNGDGIDDVIVGAWRADASGRSDAGSSYVVFGKTTGFAASVDLAALDGDNGFRLDGTAAGDGSGRSVSAAGDVNGDGFDDLIVGAPYADPGGKQSVGASYVIFGFATDGDTITGTNRPDTLTGTPLADRIFGLRGDDTLFGRGGDDLLKGGAGSDALNAGRGADSLFGGAGADNLRGGDGADALKGNDGADTLGGGAGVDALDGGDGADILYGGVGSDRLLGRAGNDELYGGEGRRDRLAGGNGADKLAGGAGEDVLVGGNGADELYGGSADDRLRGNAGNDWLAGGTGDDRLIDYHGADRFIFDFAFGADRIIGFDANRDGGQDRLDIRALGITAASFAGDVTITDLGADTRVAIAGEGSIRLFDVTGDGANTITQADFLLA